MNLNSAEIKILLMWIDKIKELRMLSPEEIELVKKLEQFKNKGEHHETEDFEGVPI